MTTGKTASATQKRLVFLYLLLLIFEGALRKWVLPSLATPLLLVRDPVLIAIYAIALGRGEWPRHWLVSAAAALAGLSVFASLAVSCPLAVTLYGFRTDFLQIPLIFLLPMILDRQDIRRMGKWVLVITIPMAMLVFLQFRAAPTHWLNATPGGQGSQLFLADGKVRPAGTFSFVTGIVSFLSLDCAFALSAFLEERAKSTVLLSLATGSIILALGTSGSRSAILTAGIVVAVAVLVSLQYPSHLRKLLAPALFAVLAFAALHTLSDFRAGLEANSSRFKNGGGLKAGIVERYLGDYILAIDAMGKAPLLGNGLGLGTNVGAQLTTGTRQFLLAEGEWERVIMESGPLLGSGFILLRLAVAFYILRLALRAMSQRADILPALLFAAAAADLVSGQWGQATVSGFATLVGGFSLAAGLDEGVTLEQKVHGDVLLPRAPVFRGRSIHGQTIHSERIPPGQ